MDPDQPRAAPRALDLLRSPRIANLARALRVLSRSLAAGLSARASRADLSKEGRRACIQISCAARRGGDRGAGADFHLY